MRKVTIGLALLAVLLIAVPATAQTDETIEIFIDGVARGKPGDIIRVHTEIVPENMIGLSCSGIASTGNNASEHPNNNFLLTSGSSSAEILDWEAVSGATTFMTGTLVLGPTITIDLELGGTVSSGGVLIVLTCAQPTPPTTTPPPPTTTPPPPTTTPPPPTTTPPTTTPGTTEAPPEGGVSAGGGATAGGGAEAAVLWLTGGALALLGGATVLAMRRTSGQE
jgi:hypothetical protein